VLAPGRKLGATVNIPELHWSAQAVPHYDYLLDDAEAGAMLAGDHCIPLCLPQAARFVWHKLYSSTQRRGSPEKPAKDRQQALLLGAVLADTDALAIRIAFKDAPTAMVAPIRPLLKTLAGSVRKHPVLEDVLRECLDG
jgi:hypothetical protein